MRPEAVSATVHFPQGFTVDDLPEGWIAAGDRAATWSDEALDESPRLALSASGSGNTP